ncbi:hypothetical protein C2845_PMPSC048693 [Panicum miliaceum]|uniref:Reverse transcriptase zinc-binding domain-containing protein n=1 Tax=Panicum miliaceum TaxID=4540 RepID=A0A3L6PCU2_PANMI|nr:hypothetical protein C2845_PMPSC048693 [Panicum miliaceum]
MDTDTRCPMCWRLDEDGGHSFLKCKQVRKCWRQLNLEEVRVHLLSLASAKEVVQAILNLNRDKQRSVISLLWAWWTGRNKANAGEPGSSVEEIVSKATVFSSEIFQQQEKNGIGSHVRSLGWTPPPPDVLKINSDAAFRENDKSGLVQGSGESTTKGEAINTRELAGDHRPYRHRIHVQVWRHGARRFSHAEKPSLSKDANSEDGNNVRRLPKS